MNKLLTSRCFQYSLIKYMSSTPANTFRPTNLQKKMLVWTKKYKTVEEVPEFISFGLIDKTKSQLRIKLANYMMILTIFGCVGAVILGKKDAERGETVHQKNLDWHKEYNESFEKTK